MSRTTIAGIYAGILGSQAVYAAGVCLPAAELAVPVFGTVPVGVPATYLGWGISLYCILLGFVLTVGVSVVTSQGTDADEKVSPTTVEAD